MHPFFTRFPSVELEITRGRARVRRRSVSPPVFLIGRAADCDLVLADPSLPDMYCYLFVRETGVFIRHIGLGPALLVDGLPTTKRKLEDQETLSIAGFAFRLHIKSRAPWGGDEDEGNETQHQPDAVTSDGVGDNVLSPATTIVAKQIEPSASVPAVDLPTEDLRLGGQRTEEYPTLVEEQLGAPAHPNSSLNPHSPNVRDVSAKFRIYLGPEVDELFCERRTA